MENGRVDGLGYIRGVYAGASAIGCCRKTDLVVQNDVNGAAHIVVWQILHLECFHNDSLSRKSSVTVDLDRHNALSIDILST